MIFILSLLITAALYHFTAFPIEAAFIPFLFVSLWPLFTVPLFLFIAMNRTLATDQISFSRSRELFLGNFRVRMALFLLFVIPLIQVGLLFFSSKEPALLYAWLPFFGAALDLFGWLTLQASRMNLPATWIERVSIEGKRAIKRDDLGGLTLAFTDLFEICSSAMKKEGDALFLSSLSQIRDLAALFFSQATSLPHLDQELAKMEKKKEDPLSYILFFLLSRLEGLSEKTVQSLDKNRLAFLFSSIARIAIAAGRLDLSLLLFPVELLGKQALLAEKNDLSEPARKGQFLLVEIVKEVSTKPDIAYQEIKTPFLSLISFVRLISETIFKKNKKSAIKPLKVPLEELKVLFQAPPLQSHPDTPLLLKDIENSIASFEALEGIMATLPPAESNV